MKGDEDMKKIHFIHSFGLGEHEKHTEIINFADDATTKEIQEEFENFVQRVTGDEFYWEEEEWTK